MVLAPPDGAGLSKALFNEIRRTAVRRTDLRGAQAEGAHAPPVSTELCRIRDQAIRARTHRRRFEAVEHVTLRR